MDMYGLSSPDLFRIDDLLDFSNDDLFSSSATVTPSTSSSASSYSFPQDNSFQHHPFPSDFTHDLCVPSDDVAQLEWLSQFVDDSFSDFPPDPLGGTLTLRSDKSFPGKARSKRSRVSTVTWKSLTQESEASDSEKARQEGGAGRQSASGDAVSRRCTHCASEKTPQWRTGPLGPKTLCNACGVRYKSGRLVPEYRPAASPTFVLTQHSNSHRKVMELRRQKEMMKQQQLQIQQQHHQRF